MIDALLKIFGILFLIHIFCQCADKIDKPIMKFRDAYNGGTQPGIGGVTIDSIFPGSTLVQ